MSSGREGIGTELPTVGHAQAKNIKNIEKYN